MYPKPYHFDGIDSISKSRSNYVDVSRFVMIAPTRKKFKMYSVYYLVSDPFN